MKQALVAATLSLMAGVAHASEPPSKTDIALGLATTCALATGLESAAARAQQFGWTGIAVADSRRLEATGGNGSSLRGWTVGEGGAYYLLTQSSGGLVQCEVLFNDADPAEVKDALIAKGFPGHKLGPPRAGGGYGRPTYTWTMPGPSVWSTVIFSPPPTSGPDAWKHSRIIFQGRMAAQ